MKVEPDAADLIATARATLLAEVAPALQGPARYAALMVANALAIAGRDLASPPDVAGEVARLRVLLGDWSPPQPDGQALREGNAELAARIRAGRFDGGEARDRLLEHLEESTRERLAVSNPKALGR